jgi:hypothetical protein
VFGRHLPQKRRTASAFTRSAGSVVAVSARERRHLHVASFTRERQHPRMNRWEVRIKGDESQLRMLAEAFKGPEWTVTRRCSEFFLAGLVLDELVDAHAVRTKASACIASISGASMLYMGSSRPLEVDQLVQLGDGGRRDITIFPATVRVHVRTLPGSLSVTRADGYVEVSLPAGPVVAAALKADLSHAVEEVLRLRGAQGLLWTDLYRILEVIQADGGSISASKAEVRRFKHTADSKSAAGDLARHGRERTEPPPNPMTLHEAREFLDRIIRDWLESR